MMLLGLVIRITITVVFLGLMMRLTGKRGWVQTRPHDVLVAFLLGNLGAALMLGRISVVEDLTAIGMLIWLHLFVTFLTHHSSGLRTLILGRPVTLLRNGVPQRATLRRLGISASQLDAMLRAEGIDRMRDVRELVLQPDGSVLLLRRPEAMPVSRNELEITAVAEEDEPWPRAA